MCGRTPLADAVKLILIVSAVNARWEAEAMEEVSGENKTFPKRNSLLLGVKCQQRDKAGCKRNTSNPAHAV